MGTTIRFVERMDGVIDELCGHYLESYDPEYHWKGGGYDGGWLEVTRDIAKAAHFSSPGEALRVWTSGPTCKCHRRRIDGYPTRPLTAYAVAIESEPAIPGEIHPKPALSADPLQ